MRRRPEQPPAWDELLTVLDGLGRLLMSIDARLAEVVELLRGDDDERNGSDS
jgi:hypothetical protein